MITQKHYSRILDVSTSPENIKIIYDTHVLKRQRKRHKVKALLAIKRRLAHKCARSLLFRITWFLSQSMEVGIPGVFSNEF